MPRTKSATKPKAGKARKAAAKARKPAAAAARAKTAKTARVAKPKAGPSTARRPAKAAGAAAKARKPAALARAPKVSKPAPKMKKVNGASKALATAKQPAKAPAKAANKAAAKPAGPAKKPIPPKAGKVAALIWYEPEQYPRVVKIMTDKGDFPPTYEAWAKPARAEEETRRAEGWEIIRVPLDPNAFAAWCASRGLKRDAEARRAYVRHAALARLHDQRERG